MYTLKEVKELKRVMNLTPRNRPTWFRKKAGICANLYELHHLNKKYFIQPQEANRTLLKYFKTWKHFSGNTLFPIPDTNREPLEAYLDTQNTGFYNKKDPYCKLRYNLVDHIIKEMENENLHKSNR